MGRLLRRGSNSRPWLGIDISAARVKLLELDGRIDAIRVAAYASEPLPTGAVVDGQILNTDVVGQAIARARSRSGSRNKNAAVSVSGAAVISNTVTMHAAMSDDDIEQKILLDAPQYIPYPIEDISFDFQIVGPDPADAEYQQVRLVACRRDAIDKRIAALHSAGLRPCLIDVEAYALHNACALLRRQMPNYGVSRTISIFEIGAQKTQLNIQHDQRSIYSREEAFGGQPLAHALTEHFGPADNGQLPEQLCRQYVTDSHINKQLNDFYDQTAKCIDGALQRYFTTHADAPAIDQILVAGGCAAHPNFATRLNERLAWPVIGADPFANTRVRTQVDGSQLGHDGPALMIAAGLSMRTMI